MIFQKEKRVDIDNALWPNHLAYNEPNESVEIQYNVLFFYLAPGTWNLPLCEESQGPSVKITHPTKGNSQIWMIRSYPQAGPRPRTSSAINKLFFRRVGNVWKIVKKKKKNNWMKMYAIVLNLLSFRSVAEYPFYTLDMSVSREAIDRCNSCETNACMVIFELRQIFDL